LAILKGRTLIQPSTVGCGFRFGVRILGYPAGPSGGTGMEPAPCSTIQALMVCHWDFDVIALSRGLSL
jgi:hypothetical protein